MNGYVFGKEVSDIYTFGKKVVAGYTYGKKFYPNGGGGGGGGGENEMDITSAGGNILKLRYVYEEDGSQYRVEPSYVPLSYFAGDKDIKVPDAFLSWDGKVNGHDIKYIPPEVYLQDYRMILSSLDKVDTEIYGYREDSPSQIKTWINRLNGKEYTRVAKGGNLAGTGFSDYPSGGLSIAFDDDPGADEYHYPKYYSNLCYRHFKNDIAGVFDVSFQEHPSVNKIDFRLEYGNYRQVYENPRYPGFGKLDMITMGAPGTGDKYTIEGDGKQGFLEKRDIPGTPVSDVGRAWKMDLNILSDGLPSGDTTSAYVIDWELFVRLHQTDITMYLYPVIIEKANVTVTEEGEEIYTVTDMNMILKWDSIPNSKIGSQYTGYNTAHPVATAKFRDIGSMYDFSVAN